MNLKARLYLNRFLGGFSACVLMAAGVATVGGATRGVSPRSAALDSHVVPDQQPDPLAPPTNGPRKADPTWCMLLNATAHVKPGHVLEHATIVLRDGKIVSVKGTPVSGGEAASTAAAIKEAKAEEAKAKGATPPSAEPKSGEPSKVEPPKVESPAPTAPSGPDGARTFDCRGLHVYAGWIDPYVEVDAPRPTADAPGQHWNARVTPQRSALDGKGLDTGVAESLRKLGFTAAAISPKGGIFRGSSAVVSLAKPESDRASARPPVYAERVYQSVAFDLSGVGGGGRGEGADNANSNWSGYPDSQMGAIALIRQTLMDADWQTAARASGTYREERNALDPLTKAKTMMMNGSSAGGGGNDVGNPPLLFNTDDELEVFRAVNIAAEAERPMILLGCGTEFRRVDGIRDVLQSKEAASLTPKHPASASTVPLIVPLNFPEPPKVGSLGQADAVELRDLMTWEQAPTNPRRLQQAGLDVSLTTSKLKDKGKFRDNLRKAVKYGLSEDDALAMVTTRPASLLAVEALMGSIEEGKVANLIVTDGPMFVKKTQIRDVWVDGKRHEINPPPATKLKGEWELTIEPPPTMPEGINKIRLTYSIDKDNAITIRKRTTKADGSEELAKASARNVRVDGNGDAGRVQFVFDHDPFGEVGVFIVSGLIEGQGKSIHGDASRSTGARFTWTAKKIADEPVSDADAAPKGFAGTWELIEANGKPVEQADIAAGKGVVVTIDKDNTVTLKQGTETHKADTVKIEGNKITVAGKGPLLGGLINLSFTGTLAGDIITGEGDNEDGTRHPLKLRRAAEKIEDKSKPQPGDKKPEGAPDAKPADPLTGTWSGTATSPQMPEPMPFTLVLTFKDSAVTGTLSSAMGSVEIADAAFAKSDENAGKLTFKITPPGTPDAVAINLDVTGNSMTGTGAHGPMSMTLNLTRSGAGGASDDTDDEEMPKDIPEKITYPFGPYAMASGVPAKETIMFTHATIWTCGPDGVIQDGWMLIKEGMIAGIGTGVIIEVEGARVIDCTGKHITPGLIDCHSHTGISRGVNESGQAVTAEVRIQDVTDPGAMSWYWQLAGGITAVNNLHGSANPIGGQNCVNKNRWGSLTPDELHFAGAIPGIKFALGENVKQSNWGDNFSSRYPKTRMGVETLIRDRFTAAREYLEATKGRSHGATMGGREEGKEGERDEATKGMAPDDERNQNVPRPLRLAKGNGSRETDLQDDQGDATRREVRVDDADAAGRGLGAVEHRGGPRTTEYGGLSSLLEDRAGIARRSVNTTGTHIQSWNDGGGLANAGNPSGNGSGAAWADSINPTKEVDVPPDSSASTASLRPSVASSLRGFSAPPPRRDLELEALAEILEGKRLIHCHSYRQDEILMLCRIAKDFGFKLGTFQHILEGYKVADEVRDYSGGGSSFSDWWAYKVEVQDAIPYDGAIMHDVGVVVSFNSDSDELARRMNVEAGKAVKYGNLAPEEALKFVTINPAKQLRIDKQVGSLEVGKDADLAIWTVLSGAVSNSGPGVSPGASTHLTVNGTPMSVFARCEQTWVDGRCYFSTERDAAMREANVKERNRLLQKLLASGPKKKDTGKADEAKPAGDGPPGGARRRRPTDDLTAGTFGANEASDLLDDETSGDRVPLLQRMLRRSADARREYYLNLWRLGIDPSYARCGDCGESNAGAAR